MSEAVFLSTGLSLVQFQVDRLRWRQGRRFCTVRPGVCSVIKNHLEFYGTSHSRPSSHVCLISSASVGSLVMKGLEKVVGRVAQDTESSIGSIFTGYSFKYGSISTNCDIEERPNCLLNHLNLNGAPAHPRPPQIPLRKPMEDVRVYDGHDRYAWPDFVSKCPSPPRASNAGVASLIGPRPPSPPPPVPSLPSLALSPAPSLPSLAPSPAPSPTSTSLAPPVEVSPPAPHEIAETEDDLRHDLPTQSLTSSSHGGWTRFKSAIQALRQACGLFMCHSN
ncbi:hypothetical protein BJY52DRAFT_1226306 [Lactarius psammicola]|nr:hypothetical protein BJY52DRAFT_1226306 [Lactarius psammicola]